MLKVWEDACDTFTAKKVLLRRTVTAVNRRAFDTATGNKTVENSRTLLCSRRRLRAISDTAICLSVCLSHGADALGAQLLQATDTLAACSLAMCGLRTRPRTDVDPPRVELPSAGAYRLAAPRGDDLLAHANGPVA